MNPSPDAVIPFPSAAEVARPGRQSSSAGSPSWGAPRPDARFRQRPVRVLTYSHDSYGLGHLRRSITLASALVQRSPHVHVLCLTGSPVPDLFDLPERCELVKIPAIGKGENGQYISRRLPISFGEIASLRSDLISATVRAFRPDLLLVDHTATGPGDELLPVLRRVCHESFNTRIVLGLRDVLDSRERSREELRAKGTFAAIRASYDDVFIYGQREVFDTVEEYDFPDDIAQKTLFVGPVVPRSARRAGARRPHGGIPHVVVTAGGGEDGYPLLRGVVAALRGPLRREAVSVTVVAGPMMPEPSSSALRRAVEGDPRITLLRSCSQMQALLDTADLVVGMGGYNTVYETLARGVALLVLPRRRPRAEQWERACRLESSGHLGVLGEDHVGDAHRVGDALRRMLREPPQPSFALRFDGAEVAARLCLGHPASSVGLGAATAAAV
jgi:predicted glycosyltransferase